MIWLVLIVIAVGAVWWRRWSTAPADNEIGDGGVARLFRLLLVFGVDGATLIVCSREDRRRRLTFSKYVRGPGDVGVRCAIPSERWVLPFLEGLRQELDRRAILYHGDSSGGLVFDLRRDAGGAHMLASLLFEYSLGLRLQRDCVGFFRQVLLARRPDLTGVDDPDVNWG
jgi:hypothetical protein